MKTPKRVTKYIVIYDVFSDGDRGVWCSHSSKRRAKIARYLFEFGIRTQKSVFEISIKPVDLEKLLNKLTKTLTAKDKIYIYPIEERLTRKILRCGKEITLINNIFI